MACSITHRMAGHAFFYFRDPKYLATISPEQRTDFLDRDSSQGKQKLAELKERIATAVFRQ